jgi:hypothetical protein
MYLLSLMKKLYLCRWTITPQLQHIGLCIAHSRPPRYMHNAKVLIMQSPATFRAVTKHRSPCRRDYFDLIPNRIWRLQEALKRARLERRSNTSLASSSLQALYRRAKKVLGSEPLACCVGVLQTLLYANKMAESSHHQINKIRCIFS